MFLETMAGAGGGARSGCATSQGHRAGGSRTGYEPGRQRPHLNSLTPQPLRVCASFLLCGVSGKHLYPPEGKLRLREARRLSPCPRDGKKQSWGLNPDPSDSQALSPFQSPSSSLFFSITEKGKRERQEEEGGCKGRERRRNRLLNPFTLIIYARTHAHPHRCTRPHTCARCTYAQLHTHSALQSWCSEALWCSEGRDCVWVCVLGGGVHLVGSPGGPSVRVQAWEMPCHGRAPPCWEGLTSGAHSLSLPSGRGPLLRKVSAPGKQLGAISRDFTEKPGPAQPCVLGAESTRLCALAWMLPVPKGHSCTRSRLNLCRPERGCGSLTKEQ